MDCRKIPALSESPTPTPRSAWLEARHPQGSSRDPDLDLPVKGVMVPGLSTSWECVETNILDVHIHFIGHIGTQGCWGRVCTEMDELRPLLSDNRWLIEG